MLADGFVPLAKEFPTGGATEFWEIYKTVCESWGCSRRSVGRSGFHPYKMRPSSTATRNHPSLENNGPKAGPTRQFLEASVHDSPSLLDGLRSEVYPYLEQDKEWLVPNQCFRSGKLTMPSRVMEFIVFSWGCKRLMKTAICTKFLKTRTAENFSISNKKWYATERSCHICIHCRFLHGEQAGLIRVAE